MFNKFQGGPKCEDCTDFFLTLTECTDNDSNCTDFQDFQPEKSRKN